MISVHIKYLFSTIKTYCVERQHLRQPHPRQAPNASTKQRKETAVCVLIIYQIIILISLYYDHRQFTAVAHLHRAYATCVPELFSLASLCLPNIVRRSCSVIAESSMETTKIGILLGPKCASPMRRLTICLALIHLYSYSRFICPLLQHCKYFIYRTKSNNKYLSIALVNMSANFRKLIKHK